MQDGKENITFVLFSGKIFCEIIVSQTLFLRKELGFLFGISGG
jgi:hypothetical protein